MTVTSIARPRLLAGPALDPGAERYADHLSRLGTMPALSSRDAIERLEQSGLLGRGGAGFRVGQKWRAVAERARQGAVVVANGAEGEPRSAKDRALMALRPHLVIDGGLLAARAVGASELVLYVGGEPADALGAINVALAERPPTPGLTIRGVQAPTGYVSGESTAVVHYLNDHDARPTSGPSRPFERGVSGWPTLVQNVESLAYAALIARFGEEWYRQPGRAVTPGTALVTVSGPVRHPGVREIEYGTPLTEVIGAAGGATADLQAVLLGGYFGGWASIDRARDLLLDPVVLAEHGLGFGCGLIGLLPASACGVAATEQIVAYMAAESARQCGPCLFGLGAMAADLQRLVSGTPASSDLSDLDRWARSLPGRGACHHPDGAAALLASALTVFADEFRLHQHRGCSHRMRQERSA